MQLKLHGARQAHLRRENVFAAEHLCHGGGITARLGIGVMNLPYGVTLEYRNGFGIVLNYSDRPYRFPLPEGSRVLIGSEELPTAGVLVFNVG